MADIRKIYKTNFNSEAYVKEYLGEDDYEQKWLPEEFYHKVFSQGKIQGKNLIDVGCGPSMRAGIIASGYLKEIYCADYCEGNLNLLKSWLRNGSNVPDFSNHFSYVAQLEGKTDTKYLQDRVRQSIKDVIFCDLLADNPLHPRPIQQFDIAASSYCLDVLPSHEEYTKAVYNFIKLLKAGGYILIVGTIDMTYYRCGDQKLPAANITGELAKKIFTNAGINVIEFEEMRYKAPLSVDSDCKGGFTLVGIKKG